jgi:hypothetical protein
MVGTIRKGKSGRNCAQTIANLVPRKKKKTLTKSQMNREGNDADHKLVRSSFDPAFDHAFERTIERTPANDRNSNSDRS